MANRDQIIAMLNDPDRNKRARANLAKIKRIRKEEDKREAERRKWGKYEAQNKAGIARSAADRARHMELVLGKDWRKQVEDGPAIRAMLKKSDARRKALDPKNDPGFLASLRNKTGIMPTEAEIERRLRAKQYSRAEPAKLTEGEAEAKAQLQLSAKELATDKGLGELGARRRFQKYEESDVQKEEDREASDTETLAILREREEERKAKEKEARRQEYKSFISESRQTGRGGRQRPIRERTNTLDELGGEAYRKQNYKDFTDEAALNAYGPPQISTIGKEKREQGLDKRINTLDELGREALPIQLAKERATKREAGLKHGGVGAEEFEKQIQRRKAMVSGNKYKPEWTNMQYPEEVTPSVGLPPGVRARIEAGDPELVGERDVNKEAAMDMADTEYAIDKEQKEKRDEAILTAEGEYGIKTEDEKAQDKAREDIGNLDEEEANAVGEEIKRLKGVGPEYVDAKEAMRDKDGRQRYVEYEGSGLVINMAALEKDIQRNENMAMLKNIPAANRPAMLAAWGYIDEADLTIAQKQSAKEIKELEVLNLRAEKLKLEAEKLKTTLTPEKKIKYEQAMTGFRQATKDKDWGTATLYASQMKALGMPLSEFDPVALQAASDAKLLKDHPPLLSIAKKHGIMSGGKPSLSPFYKQQGALSLKLSFLGKDAKAASDGMNFETTTHTGTKITFGEILNNNGIETWDQVKARIDAKENTSVDQKLAEAMGVQDISGISREAYLHYAKSKAHDVISRSVWGPAYDEIKQAGLKGRATKQTNLEESFDPNRKGDPKFKTTPGGKKFLTYKDDQSGESYLGEPDPGMVKKAKKAEKQAKVAKKEAKKKRIVVAAEKAKVKEAKDHEKEIKEYKSTVREGREMRQKTNAEKKADFMKDGTKRLDALVRGVTIKNKKRGLSGHPKFDSKEEAIKYYKTDPKGKNALKKMSLAFRHFIRNS